jgi:hypothetical protein
VGRIAVHAGIDDARDSGLDEALSARRRATVSGAGFEGDIHGGTANRITAVFSNGIRERLAFGVRHARGAVPTAA